MTELIKQSSYEGGALEQLIKRRDKIIADRRKVAKRIQQEGESQQDRLNRRMTLRNGLIHQKHKERGALW